MKTLIIHIVLAFVFFILIEIAWDVYSESTHIWAVKIIFYRNVPDEDNILDSIRC